MMTQAGHGGFPVRGRSVGVRGRSVGVLVGAMVQLLMSIHWKMRQDQYEPPAVALAACMKMRGAIKMRGLMTVSVPVVGLSRLVAMV
jgi:hypothetical protein